jgi:hypothetical protein
MHDASTQGIYAYLASCSSKSSKMKYHDRQKGRIYTKGKSGPLLCFVLRPLGFNSIPQRWLAISYPPINAYHPSIKLTKNSAILLVLLKKRICLFDRLLLLAFTIATIETTRKGSKK